MVSRHITLHLDALSWLMHCLDCSCWKGCSQGVFIAMHLSPRQWQWCKKWPTLVFTPSLLPSWIKAMMVRRRTKKCQTDIFSWAPNCGIEIIHPEKISICSPVTWNGWTLECEEERRLLNVNLNAYDFCGLPSLKNQCSRTKNKSNLKCRGKSL